MLPLTCLILGISILGASGISQLPPLPPIAGPVKQTAAKVGGAVKQAVKEAPNVAKTTAETAKKDAAQIVKPVKDLTQPLRKAAGKAIASEPVQQAVAPVKQLAGKVVTPVKKVAGVAAETVVGTAEVAKQAGAKAVKAGAKAGAKAVETVKDAGEKTKQAAANTVKAVKQAGAKTVKAANDAYSTAKDAAIGVTEKTVQTANKVGNIGKKAVKTVTGFLGPKKKTPAVSCPLINPLSADNFSVQEYTRASWYVQEQQIIQYQKIHQLRCVVATYDYNALSRKATGFIGPVLDVHNYYLGGYRTVGKETGEPISTLCASAVKKSTPAWLSVAPCFLNTWYFGGDYWVVKVGINEKYGTYDWAIVSGGPPMEPYEDGCTTKSGGRAYLNAGLWIFSRKMKMDPAQLAEARTWLKDQGYTLSQLWPVLQGKAYCGDYPGAYIKTDDY